VVERRALQQVHQPAHVDVHRVPAVKEGKKAQEVINSFLKLVIRSAWCIDPW
jgi:hypothetical protein